MIWKERSIHTTDEIWKESHREKLIEYHATFTLQNNRKT
jgi:hypothetical protein